MAPITGTGILRLGLIATTIPVKTNSLVYRATIYFNLKFAGPVS
jgi:hypothetical protein